MWGENTTSHSQNTCQQTADFFFIEVTNMICYIVYQSPWWKRLNQTVSGSVHSVHMVRNLRHCPILYTGSFHWALPGKSCCYTFSEENPPPKAIDKTIRKWDCFDQVCTSTEINSLWQYANRLKTTNFCDVPFSWFMTDIKKISILHPASFDNHRPLWNNVFRGVFRCGLGTLMLFILKC